MSRSARLEKIADIKLGIENVARVSLVSARTQFQSQENQLKQLRVYKEEYQDRLNSRMKNTISANEIQDYQYFFSSLDNAISQQTEVVEQCALQVEASRKNWLEKKQTVSKISRVAESLREQEHAYQQKSEQKESDELNLRLFAANPGLMKPH